VLDHYRSSNAAPREPLAHFPVPRLVDGAAD
jgi:hypothetical protein